MTRTARLRLASALLVVGALTFTACGGSAGTNSQDTMDRRQLTVATPFPGGAVFYPLFVAKDRGYFEQEGLDVDVQAVDGAGDALRALLTGNADVAGPGPSVTMQAVAKGADIAATYTLYQSNTFEWVTLSSSPIRQLQDLKGKVIGVSSLTAGEVPIVTAAMNQVGLQRNKDYKFLEVGDGGSATVALQKNEVDAYASAFVDITTMRLRGLHLRNLMPEDYKSFPDTQFVFSSEFIQQNPQVVRGFGRALAKATAWGMQEQPSEVSKITTKFYPDEGQDTEFTTGIIRDTSKLYQLSPEADGQWGYTNMAAVEKFMNFLLDQGELKSRVDLETVFVSNRYLQDYNNFSKADL